MRIWFHRIPDPMRRSAPTALLFVSLLLPLAAFARPAADAPVRPPPPPPMVDVPEAEDDPEAPAAEVPAQVAPKKGVSLAEASKGLVAPGEQPTFAARAWLVGVQGFSGFMASTEICYIADCDELTVPISLGGALIGGVVGFLLTQDGISAGPAAVINAGTLWGMADGLLIGFWRQNYRDAAFPATLLVTTIGLTAAGIGIATQLRPTAGQVAMANSGGIWTGLIVGLVAYGFVPIDSSSRIQSELFPIEMVSIHAGIAALGLLSTVHTVSWEHVLLIDAGGLLGTLFGFGLSVVIAQDFERRTFGLVTALGAAGGLAGATWLTRNMDVKLPALPKVSVAPMGPKGTAGVTLGGVF
jgi:hypothetical protein